MLLAALVVAPAAAGTSAESVSLTATAEAYYHGACVDGVSEQSDATNNRSASVQANVDEPSDDEPQANSMTVEDTSLWEDTGDGSFVFHDNRSGTTNDPVPDAWNIYGQPLEFDAVTVYADGNVHVDIDTSDDSNALVSSGLDATVRYVIRLSSGGHSVTVVHEGDIGDVKILPDNADAVSEFHDLLAAGTAGAAVVSDGPSDDEPQVVNSMTVEDTSLWEDSGNGFFVFHDNRSGTTNDPVPEAWNIYGQPLEFDAVTVYADGNVHVDIDTADDTNALVSSGLDATVRYVIRLSSGGHSVTVVHEGDIGDVKILPDNADAVSEFHDLLAAGTAGTAVVSDEPPKYPDLEVGAATVSDMRPETGASFTLSATVTNAGTAGSAATTLRYYRSADTTIGSSDTQVGTDAVGALAAAGTSAESISLTAPATAGTYYYGACVDSVAGESDTADNCSASVRVDVAEPEAPDLEVGTPTVSDASPETGASFTLSATVTNAGNAGSAATTLRYYRSTNATISSSDTQVGTDAVGVLAATGTSMESVSLTAPATAGTYYYGACVDSVGGESDTADNCSASVRVDVGGPERPDLEVGTPTVSDASPETGSSFTLSATVTNAGTAGSAATTLRYYRSADTTISSSDTQVGTDAVGALAAAGTSAESVSLTAPATAGTYYYGACVDSVAGESDTADNCSASVRVDVAEPEAPDLEVGTPTVSDASPETGASFTLSATVTNAGTAGSAATTLRYYRSADTTIGSSDTQVGTDAVGALAAAGTSAESVSLTAPATAGTYYYGACVDSVGGESDTADNCSASVRVDVGGPERPDLEVGTPTVSDASPETGSSFTLSATVTNAGTAGSAATTLRYYRSADTTIGSSDTQVGTDAVGALAAAGTSAESVSLTAPATAGTYYYGACVDSVAGESDTADNCSASVRVDVAEPEAPDLEVGTPTVSDASPETGASFTLSATVTNAGTAGSAATTLRYYRSTNATISSSDTQVGTDAVGVLAATGTSMESVSLTAPATAGTYYYGACVDSVAGESDTADNCSASVRVDVAEPEAPDLEVGTPTVSDASPETGASFTLSATVTNAGTAGSAATTLRYYRSADTTIGSSDTQVGTDAVGALAAAGTSAESISLTAPATAGTYYYGACVDSVGGESDTTDNCSGSVQVDVSEPTTTRPDLTVTLSFTVPGGGIVAGRPFQVGARVRNVGEAAAEATTLRYYVSKDAPVRTSETEVGTDAVEELASGGGTTESVELTAPSTPGIYYYNACVDGVEGESNTANNCSFVSIRFTIRAPAPDLLVESPSVSDASPETGASFTLSATVKNDGEAESATTTLRYYRSTDRSITSSDIEVGTDAVESLAESGTSAESIELTASGTAGTYYYGACVDAVADESDTTDNCSGSVTVTVAESAPDLIVDSFTITLGPTLEPSPGSLVKLNQRVANVGDAASAATTVRYYRSTDATITTADTEVGTDAVPELAGSTRAVEAHTENLPTTPGTYYYGACVDAVTGESSTSNNCSVSVKVTVTAPQPDLVVSASVDDSNLNTGDPFTLSATVSNAGDEQSAATTLRYYRSADTTISTADTQVGTDAVGALAASGTTAGSISLTAPDTAGAYYYGACVDAVTDESDTTNNCSSSVTVAVEEPSSGQPDLRIVGVSAFTPIGGVYPGTRIQFSASVRNYGDANSDATTLRYYRSTDATISASDTDEGTDAVSALIPSAQVSEKIDLTAPSPAGTYYYGACVDAVADESDTTNNCSGGLAVEVAEP